MADKNMNNNIFLNLITITRKRINYKIFLSLTGVTFFFLNFFYTPIFLIAKPEIDLKNTDNYFYDKFYPECNEIKEIKENYDLAVRMFKKKDRIKALFYLNNVLKYSQFSKEALNLYGVILMYDGDFENAAEFFRKSSNQAPSYKYPYINSGIINYQLQNWRRLEKICAAYLKISPLDFEANLGMGIAAFQLFNYKEADLYLKNAYNSVTSAENKDFITVMNDYRARVRGKLRRLY